MARKSKEEDPGLENIDCSTVREVDIDRTVFGATLDHYTSLIGVMNPKMKSQRGLTTPDYSLVTRMSSDTTPAKNLTAKRRAEFAKRITNALAAQLPNGLEGGESFKQRMEDHLKDALLEDKKVAYCKPLALVAASRIATLLNVDFQSLYWYLEDSENQQKIKEALEPLFKKS
jgi:hypothetical protein